MEGKSKAFRRNHYILICSKKNEIPILPICCKNFRVMAESETGYLQEDKTEPLADIFSGKPENAP